MAVSGPTETSTTFNAIGGNRSFAADANASVSQGNADVDNRSGIRKFTEATFNPAKADVANQMY